MLSAWKALTFDFFPNSSLAGVRNGALSSGGALSLDMKLCLEWCLRWPEDCGRPAESDFSDRDEPGLLSCGMSISKTAECRLLSPTRRVGIAIIGVVAVLVSSACSVRSDMLASSSVRGLVVMRAALGCWFARKIAGR